MIKKVVLIITQQENKPIDIIEIVDKGLISYRKRFREYKDLEDKFDLIYMIIEQNHLLLDSELNDEKNKFEIKLERLKNTNLILIEELEEKEKLIDYETQLNKYNSLKEEIRLFFGKICSLYANTMYERYKEDRAFEKYMAMYAEARNTPELRTQTWLTDALDNAYLHSATEAGLIDKKQAAILREQAMKMRELNEQKAKDFYELTEKLKKEKGVNKK